MRSRLSVFSIDDDLAPTQGEDLSMSEQAPPTDEMLLGRFVESDGAEAEDAFAALVRRHGSMVFGVCRGVLGSHQQAEDAFQATFLALARKAGSIRNRNVLSSWLYEVAYRVSIRARVLSARRQARERSLPKTAEFASPDQRHVWEDLRPALQEELGRLPEKYRTPVVLCYLEGKTNQEAARLLNWPVGSVKGRLSCARDLLRGRLERRGITLALFLIALVIHVG